MRWKLILSLFLVVVLVGVLLTTSFGKGYLDFLSKSIGKITLPFNLFSYSGEKYPILLSSNKMPYQGMKFDMTNSTFISKSICVTNIKVNDLYIQKADSQCDISLYDAKGSFELTQAGSMIISADAAGFNDMTGNIHVEAEVVPLNFILTGINQKQISLYGVDGDFKGFNMDGTSVDATFINKTVTINNFEGILQLKDSTMNLQGVASNLESSILKFPK